MGKSRIPVPVKAPGDKEHESYITKDQYIDCTLELMRVTISVISCSIFLAMKRLRKGPNHTTSNLIFLS